MDTDEKKNSAPEHVSEAAVHYGKLAKDVAALAPDGLPWPEGYFDRPPRVSLEEAIARNGVRPSKYVAGHPCYTQADRDHPNYKLEFPSEPEWCAELEALAEMREKAENK